MSNSIQNWVAKLAYWILGFFLGYLGMHGSAIWLAAMPIVTARDYIGGVGVLVLGVGAVVYNVIACARSDDQERRHYFMGGNLRRITSIASGAGALVAMFVFGLIASTQADPFWDGGVGWSFAASCALLGSGLTTIGLVWAYHRAVWPRNS
ncbi:MAG: hypothetical protein HY565_02935 [Candidatus Kerfeldbacteria bacterium]|nr:hypothetical protein [Candidatus Kerfeldbacteria bacterium]